MEKMDMHGRNEYLKVLRERFIAQMRRCRS